MEGRCSRRRLLRAGAVAGAVGLAGCGTRANPGETDPPVDVRGAIYLPVHAFNHYQMWKGYDPAVIERDLGYATRVNLNAIRAWVSYHWWKEAPKAHRKSIDHFLSTAQEKGIKVLLSLFDGVGADPAEEYLNDTDPATAVAVRAPATDVVEDPEQWDEPRRFVKWFMNHYANDDRLLGIEIMNEPGWDTSEKRFSRSMFRTLERHRGSVPLTVGSTSLTNCVDYLAWGADVLQFHYNFPRNRRHFHKLLEEAASLDERLDAPIWLTEYQRVRRSGGGFLGEVKGDEWKPNYSSMAPAITDTGVGSFFWSLMLQPAKEIAQRKLGTINGLFHEDGAVWSLDDARAIKAMSGDPHFTGRERPKRPEWMEMEDIKGDEGGEESEEGSG